MVETFRPASLREALDIRAGNGAVPFAGGTDLMVKLRRGAGALPGFDRPVLFLDRCPELSGIRELPAGAGLEIGATVTLAEIARSPLVPAALRDAALQMGGPALRTVATLGGNVCNASPAGDTLPFLYAFEASVKLSAQGSERQVPVDAFITGPGRTSLRRDEILRSIVVPSWSPSHVVWRKVGTRKANALTKVSIAAFAEVRDGRVTRARVALGAVAPTVVRLRQVEALLEQGEPGSGRGGRVDRDLLARAAAAVRDAVHPIDDQRSTAEYRREVAVGLVCAFLEQIARADPALRR